MRGAARSGVGGRCGAPRLRSGALALLALAASGCIHIDLPLGGPQALEERVLQGDGGPKILLVDVDGVLSEASETGALGFGGRENVVARVREQLELARRDPDVRAVLLRIQSPGGTVTASDVVYREVLRFKEDTKRPVVAHCLGMCASGGYYVALAADRILAHPTTVTGSIGVIFTGLSLAGLLEKVGVEDQTLVSGGFKDAGSPWRRMTPAERAQLQSVVDDLHRRFVDVLRAGRPGLAPEQSRALADGRIFSASQAREAGLVDDVGYLNDAVAELEKRAGISASQVIAYRRPREWSENIYSRTAAAPRVELGAPDPLAALLPAPAFLYLWWPSASPP